MATSDTIFAQSTGSGRASLMVFRLSGDKVRDILTTIAGRIPKQRYASLCDLKNHQGGLIDKALVLFFPAPHSYTGEDMAELQCHGSRAVARALSETLLKIAGVRLANAGEFSLRAFQNGKCNLVEAEGINELAIADTEEQRKTAIAQWRGEKDSLSSWLEKKHKTLLELKAFFTAMIDFHEYDIPADQMEQNLKKIADWIVSAKKLIDSNKAEIRQRGLRIAILGAPNVGKSSLLNLLAKREVAIVSDMAGTTRDVIELHLDLFGYEVFFYDTAGLRKSRHKIEKLGIAKAEQLAEIADIRIMMQDIFQEGRDRVKIKKRKQDIYLANKADIIEDEELLNRLKGFLQKDDIVFSTKADIGFDLFMEKLKSAIMKVAGGGLAGITNDRQRSALEKAVAYMEQAYLATMPEIALEEVGYAMDALGQLLGYSATDETLDMVFKNFCIGK